jgi:hypothetical protein
LRYVPPIRARRDKNSINPTSSKLVFQVHGKVYIIASGVTEHEAGAIIGWMQSVHTFAS